MHSGGSDPWSDFDQYYKKRHEDHHIKGVPDLPNKYGWSTLDTDYRGYSDMNSRSLSSTGSVEQYTYTSPVDTDDYNIRLSRAQSETGDRIDRWMGPPSSVSSPPFSSSNRIAPSSNIPDTYMYEGGSAEKTYATEAASSASHYSRHARRLYVGGIPPGQTNEDQLKNFLNEVISKCLEEENNNSYILSVYMNHKKCFAFIELKSIELTQACLELDGIMYRSSVLKIQRANEYKPELMVNVPRIPIRFNVSKAPFPNNVEIPDTKDRTLSSFIPRCSITDVYTGCVAIVGFPYDDGAKRSGHMPGAAGGSRVARQHLCRLVSSTRNPEFGLDLSALCILDIGDIPIGLALEEALSRLDEVVGEIVRRGGVPLVLGGSEDQSYATAAGLMGVAGGSIGVISVNSQLNVDYMASEGKIEAACATRLLLSDTRFCPPKDGLRSEPWCDGKFIAYAAQGAYCSQEHVDFVHRRGGSVLWLTKDIRGRDSLRGLARSDSITTHSDCSEEGSISGHVYSQHQLNQDLVHMCLNANSEDDGDLPPGFSRPTTMKDISPTSRYSGVPSVYSGPSSRCMGSTPVSPFPELIRSLTGPSSNRPVYVSFSMHAMSSAACPGRSCLTSSGLSADETLDMCLALGCDPNVAAFSISGLNPDVEEIQSGLLMAEMIYYFLMGFAIRSRRSPQTFTAAQKNHPPRSRGRSPVSSDR
eukprot:CAMPEP_0185037454 /NCGR_PEP_ID=MMETSP1103-20130426/31911_1 /TAXON_ID=36769 /ORGANISM="Paraphysomonas bandaiensis, Strain Caron Lab Isolate" /LENGTH=700 /DNA_ID=CAMNT_0027575435 /DNA_START=22 /DNA_END=2124 /DNA_ORIENTATION=-